MSIQREMGRRPAFWWMQRSAGAALCSVADADGRSRGDGAGVLGNKEGRSCRLQYNQTPAPPCRTGSLGSALRVCRPPRQKSARRPPRPPARTACTSDAETSTLWLYSSPAAPALLSLRHLQPQPYFSIRRACRRRSSPRGRPRSPRTRLILRAFCAAGWKSRQTKERVFFIDPSSIHSRALGRFDNHRLGLARGSGCLRYVVHVGGVSMLRYGSFLPWKLQTAKAEGKALA